MLFQSIVQNNVNRYQKNGSGNLSKKKKSLLIDLLNCLVVVTEFVERVKNSISL